MEPDYAALLATMVRPAVATKLLQSYPSAFELRRAPRAALVRCGCSSAEALRVRSVFKLADMARRTPKTVRLQGSQDTFELVRGLFEYTEEKMVVVPLTATLRPVGAPIVVAIGGAQRVLLDTSRVIREVLFRPPAVRFVLAHNHPDGTLEPSLDDIECTCTVQRAGLAVGLELVDHLIVVDTNWTSLRDRGLL